MLREKAADNTLLIPILASVLIHACLIVFFFHVSFLNSDREVSDEEQAPTSIEIVFENSLGSSPRLNASINSSASTNEDSPETISIDSTLPESAGNSSAVAIDPSEAEPANESALSDSETSTPSSAPEILPDENNSLIVNETPATDSGSGTEVQTLSRARLNQLYSDFLASNKNELMQNWLRDCMETRQQTLTNDCTDDTLITSRIEVEKRRLAELLNPEPEPGQDSVNRDMVFLRKLREENELLAQATQGQYNLLLERRDLMSNGTYATQFRDSFTPIDEFNPYLLGGTVKLFGTGSNNLGAGLFRIIDESIKK